MALADMYKQNNVTYYESGHGMSGVFSDTIENLMADSMIDYSIFLNTGSTWTMKNTGTIGNHFAWYADWVSGVLAVRKGPDVVSINYLGSAILSKNTSCVVANLSAKQADGAGWANFKTARFMIDAIQFTQGSAAQYVSFNYAAYSGQKYGFNSCFIESTAGYATSNTAHNYTAINDYTTLTGDNAKRIVYSNYQVMLTKYNPYMADNDNIDKYNVGYIWDFFDIGGEIVGVRDILRMPNSAHWQSWAYYHDVTDKYVTIGGFGGNVVAGTQGALPESDNVKGIFSYNNSGTSANWFTTKNAVDYKTNSLGLRWCVGNNTISTAKQWRDNVRLGVMAASGIITHDQWIVGESAIQASDNPNKNTDYDHIPGRGPGPGPGPYDDDPWSGATFAGTGVGGAGAFAKCYYMTSTELANLRSWMNSINVPEGFDPMQQIIGLSQVPVALSGSGPENVVFVNSSAVYDPGVTTRAVDTGVATQQAMGTPISYYLGSVDIVRRMQERGEPYLDYDCQIELYLPLIGMFSLDTQAVMGRTISAYAVLDPVSGTLAAYAYVSKDGQNLPVAYGSTSIGVDLPISAQQLSVSRAALKQANAQLGASLLSGALTMLAAASSGKSSGSGAKTSTGSSGLSAAGIREAGSDYMKASQVGNVFGDFMNWGRTIRQLSYGNNTAVAGSFGGSTAQWAYPFTPYVKIIRPRFEKPSNYNHSQGVPCVQTKTIGSCTGFIQCIGADVSGISGATDLELQAIQAALSNGIYAGGGQ